MADEVHYASGIDTSTNKRKYEDHSTPSQAPSSGSRRPSGFSSGPVTSPPPDSSRAPSYNSVPPPADEIQLAKQRAQEIAARLFNSADPKRPRVENGGSFDSSHGSADQKSLFSSSQFGSSMLPYTSTYQSTCKKIEIPNTRVGVIIGKSGETIKYLQLQSGAKIQVTRDMDADLNSTIRLVDLMGTPDQISKAEQLINDVLAEAEAGGSGIVSRRVTGQVGTEQLIMKVPNNKVGLVIGKGGETIKNMQATSGCRIQVIPLHLPPGDQSTERTLQIDGTSEQIETAKQLVNEVINENRLRNQTTGAYAHQGYQMRPPTSWGATAAPQYQQQGYGYVQPGAYPTPSAQYMAQQPYGAYPQAVPGAYSTGWDMSSAPPNASTAPGSGYDYYGQQLPPQQQPTSGVSAAPDTSGYNYGQTPAYQQGQSYTQDGYSGYQAPSSQPAYTQQSTPASYDQQQNYASVPGYSNTSNPSSDLAAPYGAPGETTQTSSVQPSAIGQQNYSTSAQNLSPNPSSYSSQSTAQQQGYGMPAVSQASYGSQQTAQVGYGAGYGASVPVQKPAIQAGYGQTQQSPSAQAGYVQPAPAQAGYPRPQPPLNQTGYVVPDSAVSRAPSSGFSTQPGYVAPPFGGPLASQMPYAQQQPYGASYGSGYGQVQYAVDGNSAPAVQPVQQASVAKTSPQS